MSKKGLKLGAPPPRKTEKPQPDSKPASEPAKFVNVAENDKVQFNKRISRSTADGYEMLAIKTRLKVPELLAEGLELLQEKYGKV